MKKRILYAADLENGSRPAFRMAIRLASALDAAIVYIHVIETPSLLANEIVRQYLPDSVNQQHINDAIDETRRVIQQRLQCFHDEEMTAELAAQVCEPEILVVTGKADREIIRAARRLNADMIIMGDRNESAISQIFIGSTTQKVLHQSSVPVVVVPLKKTS
jgi:nucleotide-binding universal stress UspA family protein